MIYVKMQKQCLLNIWQGLEQSAVDSAIDEWRARLRGCI